MNAKSAKTGTMLFVAAILLVGLVALAGCKKESEPTAPKGTTSVVGEQTTCPVMGGAINKNMFIEYKGKKVYFCCAGCEKKFKANPEQYIAKLPQFKD